MQVHTGYPDVYDSVLEQLSEFPRPLKTDVAKLLADGGWTSRGAPACRLRCMASCLRIHA